MANFLTNTTYPQDKIVWYEKLLYNAKQVTGKNGEQDFRTLVEKAKAVPIENFVEINRMGFIKCPWHQERTASMKYYKERNALHCFAGCGKKDVIDLVQEINKCNFKDAIKILNN